MDKIGATSLEESHRVGRRGFMDRAGMTVLVVRFERRDLMGVA